MAEEISAKLVKELRDKTGAGIMACKKALTTTNGNFEEAIKWLREKGISDASKKSDRTTSEGTIAAVVSKDKKKAVILELRCETDFVARNEDFKKFAIELAETLLKENDISESSVSKKYEENIKSVIAKFGENITLGKISNLSTDIGFIQNYIHGVGNIGTIACFETEKAETQSKEDFVAMTMGITMHIAAMNPEYLIREDVPQNVVTENREIFKKQAKESGKPDNVLEKIVDGQMNKFYGDIVLLEQIYVKDQKKKIQDVISEVAKKCSDKITLKAYKRLELGA